MAGLDPTIHALPPRFTLNISTKRRRLDGRVKPGHDGGGNSTRGSVTLAAMPPRCGRARAAPLSGAWARFQGLARQFSAASAKQGAIYGRVEQTRAPVKLGRRFRQTASTNVKFRQAMSSFVKALLDSAFCSFNALRGISLTAGPRPNLRRPPPLGTEEAMKRG
jgi:hypothetical protein